MISEKIGVFGATSFVGERLTAMLGEMGREVVCFSRTPRDGFFSVHDQKNCDESIPLWVYLAPIWTLSEYYPLFERFGCRSLVALSSTSAFSKRQSTSPSERSLAERLRDGEDSLLTWARKRNCHVTIFQPTMIYGFGRDHNVTEIANFIKKFGFFPLLGKADGKRRPVHVDDVAAACMMVLERNDCSSERFVLSGQEVLTYRKMVERIFQSLGKKARFIIFPLWIFRLGVFCFNRLPLKMKLTTEMALRMNSDLNYDHQKATCSFGFSSRPFQPF